VGSRDRRFTEQWDALDPFDPTYPHLWIKVEHLGRYLFAANFLRRENARRVADIGCGTGYGSIELANAGMHVIAIDNSMSMQSGARHSGEVGGVEFIAASLGTGELDDHVIAESLDAVVCFETLEHLVDPARSLQEIVRLLKPEGTLILSVPNSVYEATDDDGLLTNSYHRRVFSISSITDLVQSSGFRVSDVLGQPLATDIGRREAGLIKRKQTDGRIGDELSLHSEGILRRLALLIGYPEQRDVERSYSIILIATKSDAREIKEGKR
jgi:SAM-dependent methyltransferase